MTRFDPKKHRMTLRLTFRYDGAHVTLAQQERIDMLSPQSAVAAPIAGKHSGFWVELRDAQGEVLFYRVLHNPIPFAVAVHSPNRVITTIAGAPGKGQFEVLLPDLPGATTIVFFGSPLDIDRALEPAQEMGRFAVEAAPGEGGAQ